MIHGDNMKIDSNNKKHIFNKKEFYNNKDDNKLNNILYVCYTKTLTCGVDL